MPLKVCIDAFTLWIIAEIFVSTLLFDVLYMVAADSRTIVPSTNSTLTNIALFLIILAHVNIWVVGVLDYNLKIILEYHRS